MAIFLIILEVLEKNNFRNKSAFSIKIISNFCLEDYKCKGHKKPENNSCPKTLSLNSFMTMSSYFQTEDTLATNLCVFKYKSLTLGNYLQK